MTEIISLARGWSGAPASYWFMDRVVALWLVGRCYSCSGQLLMKLNAFSVCTGQEKHFGSHFPSFFSMKIIFWGAFFWLNCFYLAHFYRKDTGWAPTSLDSLYMTHLPKLPYFPYFFTLLLTKLPIKTTWGGWLSPLSNFYTLQ